MLWRRRKNLIDKKHRIQMYACPVKITDERVGLKEEFRISPIQHWNKINKILHTGKILEMEKAQLLKQGWSSWKNHTKYSTFEHNLVQQTMICEPLRTCGWLSTYYASWFFLTYYILIFDIWEKRYVTKYPSMI